MAAVLQQY